jgi:hypothetical protein
MSFGFHLTLRRLPDGRLALTVPLVFRLLLVVVGVLILLSVVLTSPGGRLFGPGSAVPLVISALALLGAVYHERWTFDRPGDVVTHRLGLAFVVVTRRYRLSEMEGLELEGLGGAGTGPRSANPDTGEDERESTLTAAAAGLFGRQRGLFFRRGPIVTLWLNGLDGESLRLETYSPSQRNRADETARALADYCGLPLRAD